MILFTCSCGGAPAFDETDDGSHFIKCFTCGQKTGRWSNKEDAAKEWNAFAAFRPRPTTNPDIARTILRHQLAMASLPFWLERAATLEMEKEEAIRFAYETADAMLAFGETDNWCPVAEFVHKGPCWIVHKGSVIEAWRDEIGLFCYYENSDSIYMTECITFAMAWNANAPLPPKQDKDR